MSANAAAFAASVVAQLRAAPAAGGRAIACTAATCIAVGKTSFEDWPRLTSSLGWTGALRRARRPAARGAVGQHLVHVHVGLRARAGLPDDQRELAVVLAREHLVGGRGDGRALPASSTPSSAFTARAGALDQRQRQDQFARHALAGDAEMLAASAASARPTAARPGLRSGRKCRVRCGVRS